MSDDPVQPPAEGEEPEEFPAPEEFPGAAGGLFDVDDEDAGDGDADERAGAHRAAGRSDSRWPLLAGLGGLVLVGLGAVAWLLSSLPHPSVHQQAAATSARATTAAPSTSEPAIPTPTAFATLTTPVPRVPAIQVGSITAFHTPAPTRRPPSPTKTPPPHGLALVPNVVGQRQAAATTILRAAGFKVSAVPVTIGGPGGIRRVVAESPPGGSLAPRGSVVTIYVTTGILTALTG
jgi:PASTA domain